MWPGLALTRSASAKAGDESINLRAKCVGNTMNFIGGDRNLLHDGIARPGFFVELGNEVCHLDIGGGGSPGSICNAAGRGRLLRYGLRNHIRHIRCRCDDVGDDFDMIRGLGDTVPDALHMLDDLVCGFCGLACKLLDLARNNRKSAPSFTRPRGFNGCV